MLGNQSEGLLTVESRVVRCGRRITVIHTVVTGGKEKALAMSRRHIFLLEIGDAREFRY